MQRTKVALISLFLFTTVLATTVIAKAAPSVALALPEGRTHDQAHDTGYIDWSGPVQYTYMAHRDYSELPPEEGGTFCGSGCWEWVTHLGNGGAVSGSFDRDVAYFEVMVASTHDSSVGNATLRACSAVRTTDMYDGPGQGIPGFVSLILNVPAGCRSWSLSASSGYLDFRSVDVIYGAPPPPPTNTWTPPPSFTPTITSTPTLTFTPTATLTSTPSLTPTPLPPGIMGQVVCDLWGNAGWCRANESLDVAASDPQGFPVTISGDLNGIPFSCGDSCGLPLPEGTGTANYSAISGSGKTAAGSSSWQRDSTPPVLNMVSPPLDGKNDWYVSEVNVSADTSDATSGIFSVAGSIDESVTWNSFPLHLSDGIFSVIGRAEDIAGNETTLSKIIRVDTVPPVSEFTSHVDGDTVQGNVHLGGELKDSTSGISSGELSVDGGVTWQIVSLGTVNSWSFDWDTSTRPNGPYTLLVRGTDTAGNVGNAASITLLVVNGAPHVTLTDRWWIWESGQLKVSPSYFPIASVKVKISNPQDRWPRVILDFNPEKGSYAVSWDRHFADGTLAPSGEYQVVAVACDIQDRCGRDGGVIAIPFVTTLTLAPTLSPTATSTNTAEPTPTATRHTMTATAVLPMPTVKMSSLTIQPKPMLPFWQLLGLIGLFLAVATASLVDPRPAAINRLKESFRQISDQSKISSLNH